MDFNTGFPSWRQYYKQKIPHSISNKYLYETDKISQKRDNASLLQMRDLNYRLQ